MSGAQKCSSVNGGGGTHQLRGVVVVQGTGRPVPGATVSIAGIQQQGVTNGAGEFALCYVPTGTHDVAAAVPGVAAVTTRRVTVPLPASTPRLSLEVLPGRDPRNVARPQSFVIGDTVALVVDGTRRASGVYDGCDLQGPSAEGWSTLKLTPDVVSAVEVERGPSTREKYGFPNALVVTTRRFERP
ncbi:MAG: hypothetical protein JWM27_4029 [Gemmatimonadetes bacterium]|nr:hypothetical protein [Gemmatimonadota bacterium]